MNDPLPNQHTIRVYEPPCAGLPPLKDPYKEFNDDVITNLGPKPVDFFPDTVKYPPPTGIKDTVNGCGCLLTKWEGTREWDGSDSTVRLETIWQPLYDTINLCGTPQPGESRFFQNPNERSGAFTNLTVAGCLTRPRRYHIWEIEFSLADEGLANEWRSVPGEGPVVILRIGEKDHFKVPFAMFHKVPSRFNTFCAPLPSPLYLPPVQNFAVTLQGLKWSGVRVLEIRCALNGYLHREIP